MNRFPLWGLFAARAALRLGFNNDESRLIGYSTALLYAIFRNKTGGAKKYKTAGAFVVPQSLHSESIPFAGMTFQCIRENGQIVKMLVGGEFQTADKFVSNIKSKFRGDWYDKLCVEFDRFLASYDPAELSGSALYSLYSAWRDSCKKELISYGD